MKVELDHLEMVADVGLDVRLGEIDQVCVATIRTAALLPHDGELLAGCGGTFKIVGKLQKTFEKPVFPIEPAIGHDRRCRGSRVCDALARVRHR